MRIVLLGLLCLLPGCGSDAERLSESEIRAICDTAAAEKAAELTISERMSVTFEPRNVEDLPAGRSDQATVRIAGDLVLTASQGATSLSERLPAEIFVKDGQYVGSQLIR